MLSSVAELIYQNNGVARFESVKEELVGRKNELEVIQFMKECLSWSILTTEMYNLNTRLFVAIKKSAGILLLK